MIQKMICLLFSLACVSAAPIAEYPAKAAYPLKSGNSIIQGWAVLSITGQDFRAYDRAFFEIRFYSSTSGGGGSLYNPCFDPTLPYPAALAVFDAENRYVGDYLSLFSHSHRVIGPAAWTSVPAGSVIGGVIQQIAGWVPAPGENRVKKALPPGTYYVQAIFYNAFIGFDSRVPRRFSPEDSAEMNGHFDKSELFRSNAVEIHIIRE
jgi:hypothetical protein